MNKPASELERGDKVVNIQMLSPCLKTPEHDCTVMRVNTNSIGSFTLTFKCDLCLRIKHVHTPN